MIFIVEKENKYGHLLFNKSLKPKEIYRADD